MEPSQRLASNGDVANPPFKHFLPQIVLVSVVFLITYLNRAMFGPLLPFLEADFNISHSASTRLLLYMSAGYAVSIFFSGFLSAIVSPRNLVTFSLVACGLTLIGIAQVHQFFWFILVFALLGIASGQYFNAGLTTMRSQVPLKYWSRAIAVHEIGPNASFFLCPILAGIGGHYMGWRNIVWIMGGVSIGMGIWFHRMVKGGTRKTSRISLSGFAMVLASPKFWIFVWLMGMAIAGQFAPFSILTLHMITERAIGSDMASALLSLSRIGAPIAVLYGGLITTRIGTRHTLFFCFLMYAIGMGLMAGPYFIPFLVGMFFQPMLAAMIIPPIFTFLAEAFPVEKQPVLLALGVPLASFAGGGIIPSILGVFGDHFSFSAGFAMIGGLALLSLPLVRIIYR